MKSFLRINCIVKNNSISNKYVTGTHVIFGDKMTNLTAILYKDDDMYVAECPEVGTYSQRETIEGAISNLKKSTELYLEEFR